MKMRTVMAFGTFDFLHPGHVFYLKKARALGDRLVVVVARDVNVKMIKGRKPLNREKERLALVRHLSFVDEAVLGDIDLRKWTVVKRFHPAVIALGYDQWASVPSLRKELGAIGLSPEIVRVRAFKPSKNKSSIMRSRHTAE
jgi:FAD synthetase